MYIYNVLIHGDLSAWGIVKSPAIAPTFVYHLTHHVFFACFEVT